MSILNQTAPAVNAEANVVEIRGAKYGVRSIPAGEFGVSAVRVVKLVNYETYDLLRTDENRLECTCPDYVVRHSDKGTCCKHLSYAVANGLLPMAPAPIAVPSQPAKVEAPKPAPRPITKQDLAAARTWGLKLPADAPRAVEALAPAPVVVAEPAPVVEPSSDPRQAWPAWTDDDRWEPTPEVDQDTRDRAAAFEPDAFELAWWSGFCLGVEGLYPAPPDRYSARERHWFICGRLSGFERSEDGQAWVADMLARRDQPSREPDHHQCEAVEQHHGWSVNHG